MSLYGNYVPENIEMTYSEFQKLEGKQSALQDEYEEKAKSMMSYYNLYDPNINRLFTGFSIGSLIYRVWMSDLYENIVPVFHDMVQSIIEEYNENKKLPKHLDFTVQRFDDLFDGLSRDKLDHSDNCKYLDFLDDMLADLFYVSGMTDNEFKSLFYVPDPLMILLLNNNNDVKGLAEIIYDHNLIVEGKGDTF